MSEITNNFEMVSEIQNHPENLEKSPEKQEIREDFELRHDLREEQDTFHLANGLERGALINPYEALVEFIKDCQDDIAKHK